MFEVGRKQMLGSDGLVYEVIEFQEEIESRTMKGISRTDGMRSLELEDGTEVYSLDNKLTIRGTRVTLSEID